MLRKKETKTLEFRKEEFDIEFHYLLCENGTEYTTTELDTINLNQLHNKYRAKHNLPFPEEIKLIRERYGLSATKMSELLGFGANVYGNYEKGKIPNKSNGKMIQMISDPDHFISLIKKDRTIEEKERVKLLEKAKSSKFTESPVVAYLLGSDSPTIFSGYRVPNIERLTEMVVFFARETQPWKTKLNKLLFYADFSFFKAIGYSISGAHYRAIPNGPVVSNYQGMFEYLVNNNHIKVFTKVFDRNIGEQFLPSENRAFNPDLFSSKELETLKKVADRFKGVKTKDIVNISHEELGWIENEEDRNIISYEYAFELND
ncbi:MAG: DNA-binding protein [uncultured Aureispira sp.]|uniref:DNA-binding protein n=1 Tax=uncultured Aureispira sp. TaxID=1331704 RepID=A0A6S6T5F2_9BACT|nr:MAG: DNA-binding protein [uncultured Aureispira sp.]